MANQKRQRPSTARSQSDGMKLHLRVMDSCGRTVRLVTLRPGTEAAYSTNFFHETWHIVSDVPGSRLLARLLWGLSYQRQAGTVVVLCGEHLKPTPFDADPSDPIVLAATHLMPPDVKMLCAIKERLPRLGPSMQTLRWRTFGMDQAVADEESYLTGDLHQSLWMPENRGIWQQETMRRSGGCVCYTAPPEILREQALNIYRMETQPGLYHREDYHFLATRRFDGTRYFGGRQYWADGEAQVFLDYRRQLSEAAQARRQVLSRSDAPETPDDLREAIYQEIYTVRNRRSRRQGTRSQAR